MNWAKIIHLVTLVLIVLILTGCSARNRDDLSTAEDHYDEKQEEKAKLEDGVWLCVSWRKTKEGELESSGEIQYDENTITGWYDDEKSFSFKFDEAGLMVHFVDYLLEDLSPFVMQSRAEVSRWLNDSHREESTDIIQTEDGYYTYRVYGGTLACGRGGGTGTAEWSQTTDSEGNIVWISDFNFYDQTRTITINPEGQIIGEKGWDDDDPSLSWSCNMYYDADGRTTQVILDYGDPGAPVLIYSYEYDEKGRIIKESMTDVDETIDESVCHEYDEFGRRISSIEYSLGEISTETRYKYEGDGMLTSTLIGDNEIIEYQYEWFERGSLAYEEFLMANPFFYQPVILSENGNVHYYYAKNEKSLDYTLDCFYLMCSGAYQGGKWEAGAGMQNR